MSVSEKENGAPLPKFGDWDVNDPTSGDDFTVIFDKARDEKKTGGKPYSQTNTDHIAFKNATSFVKQPQPVLICQNDIHC
ncbi:RIN4, pathogenic type III effector avirulence factor Avr cleavage site [Artemisia annua]|uniref:RIN4, pathogenic type III effector avirulence factor Avr cleavage site n=1 Tax=Artemisia annua TaxID=35608 RepID=A0A2U1KWP4_ARTAN|nr:RIN4, pathogenic type III effector avirulence factor Avr cleavage site [Artemisia annua]